MNLGTLSRTCKIISLTTNDEKHTENQIESFYFLFSSVLGNKRFEGRERERGTETKVAEIRLSHSAVSENKT